MMAIQRPLKGSRISSFYPIKSLPPLSSLDSAFQLQEYISLLIRLDVHDVEAIVSIPGKNATSKDKEHEGGTDSGEDSRKSEELDKDKDANSPEGKGEVSVDEACWIYEQLRRLAQDLSHPLITMLQQECTRATCPEMKAGEWLYLCVAHGNEGAMEQCCAIDYILHTLDSATALLNSPRVFPSRLSIPPISHRHFSSLARRLGRIFAHAYFHHRAAFLQAEAESALYARFLALTHRFNLVPAEFLVVPPQFASGLGEDGDGERDGADDVQPPRLLAAAVDPQRERERARESGQWLAVNKEDGPAAAAPGQETQRGKSPGHESPRRVGRSRTDTMVFSEAASVMEELGRAEAEQVEETEAAQAPRVIELASPVELVSEPAQDETAPIPEPSLPTDTTEVDLADASVELAPDAVPAIEASAPAEPDLSPVDPVVSSASEIGLVASQSQDEVEAALVDLSSEPETPEESDMQEATVSVLESEPEAPSSESLEVGSEAVEDAAERAPEADISQTTSEAEVSAMVQEFAIEVVESQPEEEIKESVEEPAVEAVSEDIAEASPRPAEAVPESAPAGLEEPAVSITPEADGPADTTDEPDVDPSAEDQATKDASPAPESPLELEVGTADEPPITAATLDSLAPANASENENEGPDVEAP